VRTSCLSGRASFADNEEGGGGSGDDDETTARGFGEGGSELRTASARRVEERHEGFWRGCCTWRSAREGGIKASPASREKSLQIPLIASCELFILKALLFLFHGTVVWAHVEEERRLLVALHALPPLQTEPDVVVQCVFEWSQPFFDENREMRNRATQLVTGGTIERSHWADQQSQFLRQLRVGQERDGSVAGSLVEGKVTSNR